LPGPLSVLGTCESESDRDDSSYDRDSDSDSDGHRDYYGTIMTLLIVLRLA
jgi:hypothetical protein